MINFFKLYFGKDISFFLEAMLCFSILMTWVTYPHPITYLSVAIAILVFVLIALKIKRAYKNISLLKYGECTECDLLSIKDTNIKVNSQRVYKYHFQFQVNGNVIDYYEKIRSCNRFKIGDKLAIFYLAEKPKKAFIPQLHGISVDKYIQNRIN